MKKLLLMLSALIIMCISLAGCETESLDVNATSEKDTVATITVCVEGTIRGATGTSPQYELAESLSKYYNTIHERVKFKFITLSSNEETRAQEIDKLQTEIMAGGGPDIFVFSNHMIYETYGENEVLFSNINKSMHSGVFADLSEMINQDENFSIDDYHAAIMNAGAIGDKRYILPLTFSYYTVLIPPGYLNTDKLKMGTNEYFTEILGNSFERSGYRLILPDVMLMLDNPIDYTSGTINVTVDEIENALRLTAEVSHGLLDDVTGMSDDEINASLNSTDYGLSRIAALSAGQSSDFLLDIAKAKANGIDYEEFAMPTFGGSYSAMVSNAIAINANSKYKSEAYEYIKLFLDPALQNGSAITSDDNTTYGSYYLTAFPAEYPVYKDIDINLLNMNSSTSEMKEFPLEDGDYTPKIDDIKTVYFRSVLDGKISNELDKIIYGSGNTDISSVAEKMYRMFRAAASE